MAELHTQRQMLSSCPLCQSREIRPWLTGRDLLLATNDEIFHYMKCDSCNLYFQSDRPTQDHIKKWYQGEYSPYGRSNKKEDAGIRRKIRLLLHTKIARYAQRRSGASGVSRTIRSLYRRQLDSEATLLDFGCGSGQFLDQARRKYHCKTIGMDFAEDVLSEVKLRGHRIVTEEDGGLSAIEDGSIDVIRLSHVIEHLYNPDEIVNALYRKLKTGGMIHLATPDPEGPSANRFNENWLGLDAPRHIMLFTPERLQALIAEPGFSSSRVLLEPTIRDWMRSLRRSRNMDDHWEGDVSVADILASVAPVRQAFRRGHADRYSLFAWK